MQHLISFKLGEFNLYLRLGGFPKIMMQFTLLAYVTGNTDERSCLSTFLNTEKRVENTATSSAEFFDEL